MIPKCVQLVLDQHGLKALEFEQGSTPTSVMAAEKIGCLVGQIAKSMLMKTKQGTFVMFLCPGDLRIDNKKVKSLLGCKARMATAEETAEQTGFKPGAVCPFGIKGLAIYVDQTLGTYPVIYPAAGTNASGVATTYSQLLEITAAQPCDVMKHPEP